MEVETWKEKRIPSYEKNILKSLGWGKKFK